MSEKQAPMVAGLTLALLCLSAAMVAAPQQGPPVDLELEPVLERKGGHPGEPLRVALQVRLDAGYHVNSDRPLDDYLIPTSLDLDPPAGIRVSGIAYPEAGTLDQNGVELAVFEQEFAIGVALDLAAELEPGDYLVPGTFRYQACDDTMCYAPESREIEFAFPVVPVGEEISAANPGLFAGMTFEAADSPDAGDADRGDADLGGSERGGSDRDDLDRIAAREDPDVLERLSEFEVLATTGGYLPADDFLAFIERAESGAAEESWFENRGPLAILALVLLGGLALNLTPCVLPLIPINLAIIGAGSRASSRGRGFALGATYGLAMAAVYGGLGLVVVLTAGTFGTINSSPWFNLGIAVLFVVLTLAMFDVVTIDFSRLQSKIGIDAGGKGSFLAAFGMGAVAALLAGACVAPVVIQVVVFASDLYARGTTVALALPFFLGLGMALPWPLAGAGLSLMPEPGPWMVRVKHALGLFILATAAYYGWLSYELFAQRWVDPRLVAGSVEEKLEEGWYPTLSQGMEVARQEDKLLLVDIWATWCKNCLTMDKTTLADSEVREALSDYVKVKFQAEDMSVTPARQVMDRFDAIGLPAYAILRPGRDVAADGGGERRVTRTPQDERHPDLFLASARR